MFFFSYIYISFCLFNSKFYFFNCFNKLDSYKFLENLEFILYGIIQGLTEFIPISSTAHLKVISLFLGINDPGPSISAIIQLGSLLALVWYFRYDIFKLRSQTSKKLYNYYLPHKRLLRSIFISSIPIILLGGTIKLFVPYFFYEILRSNLSIALVSFLMAIFMFLAENKKGYINIKNHNYSDSFLIGFSQAFAIFPGFSRSGVTISTALLSGWKRSDAVKFSFLIGIPAIFLSSTVEIISSFKNLISLSFLPLILGLVSTFLTSLFVIDFLLKYFSSNGLKVFIIYRVIFGVVILLNL